MGKVSVSSEHGAPGAHPAGMSPQAVPRKVFRQNAKAPRVIAGDAQDHTVGQGHRAQLLSRRLLGRSDRLDAMASLIESCLHPRKSGHGLISRQHFAAQADQAIKR